MMEQNIDRYVSFQGIDCDQKAHQVLDDIERYIKAPPHQSAWIGYFQGKLRDRLALGQDELYFVGSQINSIRSLFEEYGDTDALELLEWVEEECC